MYIAFTPMTFIFTTTFILFSSAPPPRLESDYLMREWFARHVPKRVHPGRGGTNQQRGVQHHYLFTGTHVCCLKGYTATHSEAVEFSG